MDYKNYHPGKRNQVETKIDCPYCQKSISISEVYSSITKYGFILFNNNEYNWFGLTCPHCPGYKTIFKKFHIGFRYHFIDELYSFLNSGIYSFNIIQSVQWVYNSFPYNLNEGYSGVYDTPMSMLRNDLEVFNKIQPPPNTRYSPIDKYDPNKNTEPSRPCSYCHNCPALGPMIDIFYYDADKITELAEIESSEGVKIFPRWIINDPLYIQIQRLCWNYRLQIKLNKKTTGQQKPLIFFSPSSKMALLKRIDFMNILDMVHADDLKNFPEIIKRKLGTETELSLLERAETASDQLSGIKHDKYSKKIWNAFIDDSVQELLDKLSDGFIDDYISLAKKTSFTFDEAYKLKDQYLVKVAEAIDNADKKRIVYEQDKNNLIKEVKEAEKLFPKIEIISANDKVMRIKRDIKAFSLINTDKYTTLILGETGTGKELFAKAIHASSGRGGKFVKVDCGALAESVIDRELFGHVKGGFTGADRDTPGRFGLAEGGTLFLDEIGNIPLNIQGKLLSFLQDWEYWPVGSTDSKFVNAMVILATNLDLDLAVDQGKFKEDLYYRINGDSIVIPPLRDRKEDIQLLFEYFLNKYLKEKSKIDKPKPAFPTMGADFIRALKNHFWKGNVRELEKYSQNIAIGIISKRFIPPLNENHWMEHRENIQKTISADNTNIIQGSSKRKGLPKDDMEFLEGLSKYEHAKDYAAAKGVSGAAVSKRKTKIAIKQNL